MPDVSVKLLIEAENRASAELAVFLGSLVGIMHAEIAALSATIRTLLAQVLRQDAAAPPAAPAAVQEDLIP